MKTIKNKKSTAVKARAEYIKAATNVNLHITDGGEGTPIVLIHGWPLSDEMYEYQYQPLINSGFRVMGITLRGFGKSDQPFGDMHGKKDKIRSFDLALQMKTGIKNSKLVPFENSGHSLFLEEAKKFNKTLIKFALP